MPAPIAVAGLSKALGARVASAGATGSKYEKLSTLKNKASRLYKGPGVEVGIIAFLLLSVVMGCLWIFWIGPNFIYKSSPPPLSEQAPPSRKPPPSEQASPTSVAHPDGKGAPPGYIRTTWNKLCDSDCEYLKDNDSEGLCSSARPSWRACYVEETIALEICNGLTKCGGYKCGTKHTDGGITKHYCYLLDTTTAATYWSSGRDVSDNGSMYIKKNTK